MNRVVIIKQSAWDRLPVRLGLALADHADRPGGFVVTDRETGQPIEGEALRNHLIGILALAFMNINEGVEHEDFS